MTTIGGRPQTWLPQERESALQPAGRPVLVVRRHDRAMSVSDGAHDRQAEAVAVVGRVRSASAVRNGSKSRAISASRDHRPGVAHRQHRLPSTSARSSPRCGHARGCGAGRCRRGWRSGVRRDVGRLRPAPARGSREPRGHALRLGLDGRAGPSRLRTQGRGLLLLESGLARELRVRSASSRRSCSDFGFEHLLADRAQRVEARGRGPRGRPAASPDSR